MKKILIVDDQIAIRTLLKEVLCDIFEVNFATSGEEAMDISKKYKPDIILLDFGLPGMNGIDVLPTLKTIVPDCSIIILTGSTNNGLLSKAMSLGAVDYIGKPFDIFKLRDKLVNIVSKKAAI